MKTAACYIRVSTDDQLEFSPDSQLKLIQDYAEKNEIILLEEFIFIEENGISGKTMNKRPEFMKMISVAKKKPKPFDIILVWKFSRFARNMEEAITLKSMLKKNNIDVVSISEPVPSGPFGDLIERVIEWSDSYYLVNLSQEVKRGMKERASRGLPVAPPPIGYDSKDGTYVPNSDSAFVEGIFTDFLSGMGLRAIAIKYGNLGMKTTRGNIPDNRCIEYMLRNPVYTGKIRWSTDGRAASTRHYDNPNIMVSDGQHKPIIEKKLFDAVQEKLDEQKRIYGKYQRREQPVQYMLKGLVRCSACGSTLVFVSTQSPSMQCHSYGRGTCRTSHSITVQRANHAIISYLENVVITGDVVLLSDDGTPKNNSSSINYKKLIENEKAKLIRIRNAYENGIDTIDEYRINKARITESIKKLEDAATSEVKLTKFDKKAYLNRITNVLNIIRDPKISESVKNTALRTIINKIIFHKPTNTFEVYFY